ncbi:MAG: PQQ-dependent sugar dehydrogenase [Steroidobacter sp.]
MMRTPFMIACTALLLSACSGADSADEDADANTGGATTSNASFTATAMAKFNEPWAMTFLPDGRLLVTEKKGALKVYAINGPTADIRGTPEVDYGGQGGFGDVVLHPDFANNQLVYLSYAEAGQGDARGAAVARGKLTLKDKGGEISNLDVIWRQAPKVAGRGHYGHRIAFGPDGHLWISSGERQKFDPAQDMRSNLGKIVRLNEDGSTPSDNPFAKRGGVTAQIWSLGHRNPLGIAFDAQGRLWIQEMGPRGGDELNLVERGANYGYPLVSNGDHYDGRNIPNHETQPDKYRAPKIIWNPVISPGGLIIYTGSEFPDWQGDAFIGGMSAKALIRVEFDGENAREAERFDMGRPIREVEQGPDGALWVLEDERGGSGGRLLKLTRPR